MLKAWVVGARSGEALRGFARCGRDVRCLEDGVCLAGDKQFVRSQSVNGWSWSNFAGRVIDSCVRLNGPLDLSAITQAKASHGLSNTQRHLMAVTILASTICCKGSSTTTEEHDKLLNQTNAQHQAQDFHPDRNMCKTRFRYSPVCGHSWYTALFSINPANSVYFSSKRLLTPRLQGSNSSTLAPPSTTSSHAPTSPPRNRVAPPASRTSTDCPAAHPSGTVRAVERRSRICDSSASANFVGLALVSGPMPAREHLVWILFAAPLCDSLVSAGWAIYSGCGGRVFFGIGRVCGGGLCKGDYGVLADGELFRM